MKSSNFKNFARFSVILFMLPTIWSYKTLSCPHWFADGIFQVRRDELLLRLTMLPTNCATKCLAMNCGRRIDTETVYVIDDCADGHLDINMQSLGSNSSGILKLSKDGRSHQDMHCEITLNPPLAYGVVASIRLIDLPGIRSTSRHCNSSYLKMLTKETTELCGFSKDESEYKSFETWNPMKIIFHMEKEMLTDDAQAQFQITFTAARQAQLWCSKEEFMCNNKRCIWQGHTCNGHNNCGDLSDESSTVHCGEKRFSTKESIGIIIGTVVFCIVLVTVVAYLRRRRFPGLQSFPARSTFTRNRSNSFSYLLPPGPPKYEDIQRSNYNSTSVTNNTVAIRVENLPNQTINS